jgi:hypothetical protein
MLIQGACDGFNSRPPFLRNMSSHMVDRLTSIGESLPEGLTV